MKVVKPRTILPANVQATNLSRLNPLWSSSASYVVGDKVDLTTDPYTYECIQNNTNNDPVTATTFWRKVAYNNLYAAFDQQVSTVSASSNTGITNTITYTLSIIEIFDSVSLFNLKGKSVRVEITAPGVTYDSGVRALDDVLITDWYDYFFSEIVEKSEIVFTDIPPVLGSATVQITIESRDNTVAQVGAIVIGSQFYIGTTDYGTSVGIIDFSRKETDEFGNTTFVQRAFSKRISAPVTVAKDNVKKTQRVLSDLRATPCVWIGAEDETYGSTLTTYGFYRDFSLAIEYPSHSLCELEIEGLT